MSAATVWREYLRGQPPPDWSSLGDATATWPVRAWEIDPARWSWIAATAPAGGGRGMLTWQAADADPSRPSQEILLQFALVGSIGSPLIAYLRASAKPGFEQGYGAVVGTVAGTIAIYGLVAGVQTLKVSQALTVVKPALTSVPTDGTLFWLRFRAAGTAISIRMWQDGDAEPVAWTATTTSSTWTDGSVGLGSDQQLLSAAECRTYFFSYATGGATAPGPSSLPAGLAAWSLDSGSDVELTAELRMLNPDTGVLASSWFSTHGRRTGPYDYPPSVDMPPLLSDPGDAGGLALTMTADPLFDGGAPTASGRRRSSGSQVRTRQTATAANGVSGSMGAAKLRNPRNLLAYLLQRACAGREFIVRAGLRGSASHRSFDVLYSSVLLGEPSFETDGTVTLNLQDPYRQLAQNLLVRYNIGIPTAISLAATTATNAYITQYDLTTFAVAARWTAGAAPTTGNGELILKRTSVSAENFFLYLEVSTGRIVARASIGGVGSAIFLRSPLAYVDGAPHWALFGVDGVRTAYLIVDGQVVAQSTPPGLVDLPAAGLELGANLTMGMSLFDVRIYGYCPDPYGEAQVLMAQRSDMTEPSIVLMAHCDDGLGATITDYSANANHLGIAGTVHVNYDWVPTDLGEPAQAGKIMPLTLGTPEVVTAELIDNDRQRFRTSDGISRGAIFRQRGFVTDVAGSANGFAEGVYEFGSAVSQPVTFDQGPDSTISATDRSFAYAPAVAEDLMRTWQGMGEADYDPYSVDVLRAVAPYEIGLTYTSEVVGGQALSDALSWGGHYRLDAHGRIALGMVAPTVTPGPYPGESCLEFGGNLGAGITFPGYAGLGNPFTIAFWVKSFGQPTPPPVGIFSAYPNGFPLVGQGDGSTNGFACALSNQAFGQFAFATFPEPDALGHSYLLTTGSVAPWATWVFVMMVHRTIGGILPVRDIFVGVKGGVPSQVATGPAAVSTFAPPSASQSLFIAGGGGSARSLPGSVGHAQIWNSALSATQGQALMLSHPVGTESGLLFYAPLNEGSGSVVYDKVSGRAGRVRGGRWAPRLTYDLRKTVPEATLKVRRARPAWNVLVPWGRNATVLSDADIAGAVSPADAVNLKRAGDRVVGSADPSILAAHLDAILVGDQSATTTSNPNAIPLASTLMKQGDARAVNRMLRYRLGPQRVLGQIANAPRSALSLALGDEVWVYHPAMPWPSQGAAFRVIGLSPSLKTLRTLIDLWGDQLDAAGSDILADGGAPILSDSGQPIVTG